MTQPSNRLSEATHRMVRRTINHNPYLSAADERAYLEAWRERGDIKARDRLLLAHMPIVLKMVSKLYKQTTAADDLIGCAFIGLTKALERFDPARGYRFNTFARWWADDELKQFVYDNRSMLRGPRTASAKTLSFNLNRIKLQLGIYGALTPADAQRVHDQLVIDVPSQAGITLEAIMEYERFMMTSVGSASSSNAEDDAPSWIESIADDAEPIDSSIIDRQESTLRKRLLHQAVDTVLNDRQKDIFVGRSLSDPPATLQDLGDKYSISRERVRQIEMQALEKVQKAIKRMMNEHEQDVHERGMAARAVQSLEAIRHSPNAGARDNVIHISAAPRPAFVRSEPSVQNEISVPVAANPIALITDNTEPSFWSALSVELSQSFGSLDQVGMDKAA